MNTVDNKKTSTKHTHYETKKNCYIFANDNLRR